NNLLEYNGFDLSNMHFISLSRMFSWYKRYRVRKDLKKGAETGYQIGNKYNINKSTVYIIKKEIKENKPLLSSTSTTQQQIYLENIEINEQYKKETTIQELEEKYNVEECLLNVLQYSKIYDKETIENIVKNHK